MDHLPFPSTPISCKPRIPLLCAPDITVDFFAYPTGGKTLYITDVHAAIFQDKILIAEHKQSENDIEAFIQAWLYFSILESFGLEPLRYVEDGFVQTRNLCSDVDGWTITDTAHLRSCLLHATAVLNLVYLNRLISNNLIRISTLALHEVLAHALDRIDGQGIPMITGYAVSQMAKIRLLEHGWCPFEIHTHFSAAYEFSHIYYLQHLNKGSERHPDCNENACKRATVNSSYEPRHVCGDTSACELIGLEFADVKACLDNGIQPVIDIQGTSSSDLTLAVGTGSYVAYSHVWSDGLGNPNANTLPRCQLFQIMQEIRDFEDKTKIKLCFWLDTLCCPMDPVYKQMSLKTMASVYRDSYCAVVIDAGLSQHPVPARNIDKATVIELGIRIATSRWAHRLWTLQEAGLPPHLLVRFGGNLIGLESIWRVLPKLYLEDRAYEAIGQWLVHYFGNLRASFIPRFGVDRRRDLRFFVQRRVSEPTDEAICLATLLGVPIPDALPEQRMDDLWATISIPQSIIFNKFPRSCTWRWAPSTLLISDTTLDLDRQPAAFLSDDGLLVTARRQQVKVQWYDQAVTDLLLKLSSERPVVVLRGAGRFTITDAFVDPFGRIKPDAPGTLRHRYGSITRLLRDDTKKWHIVYEQGCEGTALLAYEVERIEDTPVLRSTAVLNIVRQSYDLQNIMADQFAQAFKETLPIRCLRRIRQYQQLTAYSAAYLSLSLIRAHLRILRGVRDIVERFCYSCLIAMCRTKPRVPKVGHPDTTVDFHRLKLVTESFLSLQAVVQSDTGPGGLCFID